ncbi:unnamed protein product [Phytomonas sp. Hart1]|nr:unnamed protein product [Phytomonas sp. Hart1]|eukprot:CCW71411.1 unnamed protein product [Phytomonas sp. isolate Hart1]
MIPLSYPITIAIKTSSWALCRSSVYYEGARMVASLPIAITAAVELYNRMVPREIRKGRSGPNAWFGASQSELAGPLPAAILFPIPFPLSNLLCALKRQPATGFASSHKIPKR